MITNSQFYLESWIFQIVACGGQRPYKTKYDQAMDRWTNGQNDQQMDGPADRQTEPQEWNGIKLSY